MTDAASVTELIQGRMVPFPKAHFLSSLDLDPPSVEALLGQAAPDAHPLVMTLPRGQAGMEHGHLVGGKTAFQKPKELPCYRCLME